MGRARDEEEEKERVRGRGLGTRRFGEDGYAAGIDGLDHASLLKRLRVGLDDVTLTMWACSELGGVGQLTTLLVWEIGGGAEWLGYERLGVGLVVQRRERREGGESFGVEERETVKMLVAG